MTPEPACRPIVRAGADLWHKPSGSGEAAPRAEAARIRDAKAVCATCPVKAACLAAVTEAQAQAQAPHAPTVRDQSRLPAPPIQGRARVRRLPESDPGRVQSAAREGGVTKPCDEFCPFSACHACPWKGGKAPRPDLKETR